MNEWWKQLTLKYSNQSKTRYNSYLKQNLKQNMKSIDKPIRIGSIKIVNFLRSWRGNPFSQMKAKWFVFSNNFVKNRWIEF